MACSCSCEFVRWRVETIRFTQSNTRYMDHVPQGTHWAEVEVPPPPGPTPELPIPGVFESVKKRVREVYRLTDSDGRCDPDGEFPCRCVRVSKFERVLTWSVSESCTTRIPPLGGKTFWTCQIDFEAIVTKYRARGECVPASLPGHPVEVPTDSD